MTIATALHSLFVDAKFQAALWIILVDFVLGIAAAFKLNTFRLSYVSRFAKDDVLEKLVPWLVLYLAAIYAGDRGIGPFDFGVAAMAIYVTIVAAWTGSILASLEQLGLKVPQPRVLAAPEHTGPPAP